MDQFGSITNIQQNMASRLQRDMSMDKTVEILSIIQGLVTDKFGRVTREAVIIEAQLRGMSEDEVLSLIKNLVANRTLKEQDEYLMF